MKKIFNELINLLTQLVETKVDLMRLKVLEFVSATIAVTITLVVSFLVLGLGVFFCSIALAFFLNELLESSFLGFLVVGGLYLLIGIVLALLIKSKKKPLFIDYIIKHLSQLIYEQKDNKS